MIESKIKSTESEGNFRVNYTVSTDLGKGLVPMSISSNIIYLDNSTSQDIIYIQSKQDAINIANKILELCK